MPRKCNAFNYRGNYREPYSKVVSFPKDLAERKKKCIKAISNYPKLLANKKEVGLWVCASHFDCEWVTVNGGKRPCQPPPVFLEVPMSFFKQVQNLSRPRSTQMSCAEGRVQQQKALESGKDKISSFENFASKVDSMAKVFKTDKKEDEVSLYLIDFDERRVTIFLKFR